MPKNTNGCLMPMNVMAAKKKVVKLNKTKVTITVGKKTQLKLKNVPKSSKIKWSSNKKIATVTQKGKVTAKKAGKAKITAKVGKKKYTCTVTVKNKKGTTEAPTTQLPTSDNSTTETSTTEPPTTEKPVEKNSSDVAALQAIIQEQKAVGADVPEDLNSSCYTWDEKGRLTGTN